MEPITSVEPSVDDARLAAPASTAGLEISTKSVSNNPSAAPAGDSKVSDSVNGDKSAAEIEHDDQDEENLPKQSENSAATLEGQIRILQDKLKDIEKSNEEKRLEDEKLNRIFGITDMPPSVSHSMAITSSVYNIGRRNRLRERLRYLGKSEQEIYEYELEDYTDNAITSYEREITRLKKQKSWIQNLQEDLERLRDMEREWDRERGELHLKQEELDKKLGRPKEITPQAPTTGEKPEVALPPEFEVVPLRAEWSVFKMSGIDFQKEPKACHAIDILKGEPSITFEPIYLGGWTRGGRRQGNMDAPAKTQNIVASTKKPLSPGELPLAERIRINSTHIAKMLAKFDSENITNSPGGIMIRPYKILAFFDEPIRQKLQELERKFVTQEEEEKEATLDTLSPESKGQSNEVTGDKKGTRSSLDAKALEHKSEDISEGTSEDAEFTDSLNAYNHLKCLVEFMDTDIRAKKNYLATDHCVKVSFADLWYLFKPGDEVVGQNRRQAYRIIKVTSASHKAISPYPRFTLTSDSSSDETPIVLHCVYVDFDGKTLGPISKKVKIQRYDGEKDVTSLEVFPLRFVDLDRKGDKPAQSFRDRLIERGRSFLDVTTFKHMHYSGFTLDQRNEIDSNVVVDFEEAFTANPDAGWRPEPENLIGAMSEDDVNTESCTAACCVHERIYLDAFAEKKRNQEYIGGLIPEDRNRPPSLAIYPRDLDKTSLHDIDPRDLLIMSYRVFAFVLRSREWAVLDISHLGPPVSSRENSGGGIDSKIEATDVTAPAKSNVGEATNIEAMSEQKAKHSVFDDLVIPKEHKRIIRSLVAQHFTDKDTAKSEESRYDDQVDIVRGKGKGLIILLHGAPGVGKTSTAEAVAEMFERPLFQITCGDLGESAAEVDKALSKNFNLASKWGCVLLLDEADVFLAARSKEDFKRNGMVAVFLRVLEYYAGILFLTTNRVGDFDEAFTSRIHISLYYRQLDLEPTKDVFKLNFRLIRQRFKERGRLLQIKEPEMLKFVEDYWTDHKNERWNGRQIRNACQTALALAEVDAQGEDYGKKPVDPERIVVLEVHQLKVVSAAYLDFMEYLNKVRNKDQEGYAKSIQIRAMEYEVIKELAAARQQEKEQKLKEEREKKKEEKDKRLSMPALAYQHDAAQPSSHLEATMRSSISESTPRSAAAMPSPQPTPKPGGHAQQPPPYPYPMPPGAGYPPTGVGYPPAGAGYPHPGAGYASQFPGYPYYLPPPTGGGYPTPRSETEQ